MASDLIEVIQLEFCWVCCLPKHSVVKPLTSLDMDKHTIEWVHNGKHLGIAYQNMPDRLYAAVSFNEIGDQVTLVFPDKHKYPRKPYFR